MHNLKVPAVMFVAGFLAYSLSIGSSSELSLEAYDELGSQRQQVDTQTYIWKTGDGMELVDSGNLSADKPRSFSLDSGNYISIAFGERYPYADPSSISLSSDERDELEVYRGASRGNVTIKLIVNDTEEHTGPVPAGRNVFRGVEVSLSEPGSGYNPYMVTFGYPDRVEVEMPDARGVSTPETAAEELEYINTVSFISDNLGSTEGPPVLQGNDSTSTGQVITDARNRTELEILVQDRAPYVTDGEFGVKVQDSSPDPDETGVGSVRRLIQDDS